MKNLLKAFSLVLLCVHSTGLFADITSLPLNKPAHNWMDKQIVNEFASYEQRGFSLDDLEKTWRNCLNCDPNIFGRYQVINSQVYGPEGTIKNLLYAMTKHYQVPDIDFIYGHCDIVQKNFFIGSEWQDVRKIAPIFVSAKEKGVEPAIIFMDWYYDILNKDKRGWNVIIHEIDNYQQIWPWDQKINKLFWRGAPTDGPYTLSNWSNFPRGKMIFLSHYVAPVDLDAAFAGHHLGFVPDFEVEQFKRDVPYAPVISQKDHLQYKYQLVMDGITATSPGYQWRLLSGCATFKQETDHILWFNAGLEPFVHYIPFKKNCDDILVRIHWAKTHDDQVKKIAKNARKFAHENLMPEHILLYCYKALLKYAELQRFNPRVYKGFQPPHPMPEQK